MTDKKEAQIVLRLPTEAKNKLVKASQAEGKKLTEWTLGQLENVARFGPTHPPVLEMDKLPRELAENWHIYLTVRSSAQVKHAREFANTISDDQWSSDWQDAFDYAALEWSQANPHDEMWSTGNWPENAALYPSEEAFNKARRILGLPIYEGKLRRRAG